MPEGAYSLAYESLGPDCTTVQPGHRGTQDNLDAARVRACLEAFAAIPAVDLVDIDAKIRLRFEHRLVAVARSGSTLYFTPLPEVSHTPVPSTPDGIMAHLTGIESAPAPAMGDVPVADEAVMASTPGPRSLFKLPVGAQLAVLAVTASMAAGLGYHVMNENPPGSYAWIKDSDRTKELHAQLDGEYGDPAAEGVSFVISGGTLSIYYTPGARAPRELVRAGSFRLGLREGGIVALILRNGDVLEVEPDGSLRFGAETYRRAPRR